MAAFVFDGTSNVTAAKADTVVLTANPATFTSAAESNGNVVLTFGSQTLTITGTTLAAGNLSGVTVPNGQFLYATSANAGAGVSGNTLAFLLGGGTTTTLNGTSASSVSAAFGGLGRADSLDNAETIAITSGAKGSYLIYGNEGADKIIANNATIGGTGAVDSNSAVTVFGGRGQDTIDLGTQGGAGTNFAVYGGESGDAITLNHTATTGNVTIFGGTGAIDPNDGNDTIALGSISGGSSFNVFAGGGDDIVTSTGGVNGGVLSGVVATFANGTSPNIYGGNGNDTISVGADVASAAKATITVYGGAGADSIYAANNEGGTTTVYGGTAAADATDGADNITIAGAGSFTVYADAGNDVVTATGLTQGANALTTATIFGGRGDDQITAGSTAVKANLALFGGENASDGGDVISAFNAKGGSTIIYGGTAAADSADGADVISFSGQGATTIYAAGGNDTVNIKGLSTAFTDTGSTDKIFGGVGNDSITIIGAQTTNGTHTVALGDGADIFVAGARAANLAADTAPTVAVVDGGAGQEVSTVTFGAGLTAGNSFTVGGLTFKSNVDLTATQVAAKFASVASGATGATLNGTATDGVYSGTMSYAYSTGTVQANGGANNQVVFTATANGNQTDITATNTAGAANGSGQTIEITDFTLSQGDTLVIQNGIAGGGTLQTVDASSAQTIQTALDLAVSGVNNNPAGAVSAVVFQGSTYVVVNNDGNATFNANTDLAIKLTGVSTVTGLAAATTIV